MNRKIQSRPGPVRRMASAIAAPVRKAASWARGVFTLATLHTSAWFSGFSSSWGDQDYTTLKARAFGNPFSWRAFSLVAFAFQSIPWLAYRRVDDPEKPGATKLEEVQDHPLAALLRRPSPRVSFARFVADVIDHLTFGGEVFLYAPESEITGRNAGKPGAEGLHLLRPDRIVRIEHTDEAETEPSFYHYQPHKGGRVRIPAGRVRHFYLFEHPEREGRGWPLAAAAARAVELMRSGDDWQKGIYDNKGRHPGFFKISTEGGRMDDAGFERTKAELQESYSADANSGLPGLLEDVEWQPNGMTVREADAVRVEQQAARRVAVGYGVMSPLLGDADNMTYDNLKTSLKALLNHTVRPILDWMLTELTAAYMPMYERDGATFAGAYLDYDPDQIDGLEEDKTAATERAVRGTGRPFITVNEAREQNGWTRLPDPTADVLYAPISMIPASDAGMDFGAPTEAAAEADKAVKDSAAKDGHGSSVDDVVLKLTKPETA